jgi:hypothetical protein
MRLIALQGIDLHRSSELSGYPLPSRRQCFHCSDGFSPIPSPCSFDHGSSPHGLHLLYKVLAACHPPDLSRTPPLGFLSFSRHQHPKSTICLTGFHTRLGSAHSVSHAHDVLLLQIPCGLISSHHHVQDFTPGVFPAAQPPRLSTTCTLMSLAPVSCR